MHLFHSPDIPRLSGFLRPLVPALLAVAGIIRIIPSDGVAAKRRMFAYENVYKDELAGVFVDLDKKS